MLNEAGSAHVTHHSVVSRPVCRSTARVETARVDLPAHIEFGGVCAVADSSNTKGRLNSELEELRMRGADIPFILSSGYSDFITPESSKSIGFSAFLSKPSEVRELGRVVHQRAE